MKIAEMLRRGTVIVPLEAADLEGALTGALRGIPRVADDVAKKLASDLVAGVSGEIHRVHERAVVAYLESDAVAEVSAVIGVSPGGYASGGNGTVASSAPPSGGPDSGDVTGVESRSEMVAILVTPRSLAALRDRTLPALKRFFRDENAVAPLLSARSADAVSRVSAFMDLDPNQSLLVEDVVEPVKYRVYPDTPYSEVADLMVRRELQAVPVVGEDYEFLGVITSGNAMEELVSRARAESGGGAAARTEPTAREIMTRTVMCVSEEQSLIEAASIMVNRDVQQLPVIREGEVVGLLTRREVLRWLFPDTSFDSLAKE